MHPTKCIRPNASDQMHPTKSIRQEASEKKHPRQLLDVALTYTLGPNYTSATKIETLVCNLLSC